MSVLYLDHASTTPCREEVWEAMKTYALFEYGNPDSLHSLGRKAREAVDEARRSIGEQLGCSSKEIIFTAGGSESDNMAILGVADAKRGRHLITTRIEHLAVLRTCEKLEAEGFEVTYLDVDEHGLIDPEAVARAIRADTVLVSIAHTNNEIGTHQPIAEISRLIKRSRPDIIFHTDAVQAVGHVEINVQELGVDLLSFTAQKFYGPKGIGGLFVRQGVELKPLVAGVRHERVLEIGTLSVPLIVGMSLALKRACADLRSRREYWSPIRDALIKGLLSIEESRLNGHPTKRLSTNISVCFAGVSGEDIVLKLDRLGICASTGSACTSGIVEPSHVLTAIGVNRRDALGALRLSLGDGCLNLDPTILVDQIRDVVEELRSTNYSPARNRHSAQIERETVSALI